MKRGDALKLIQDALEKPGVQELDCIQQSDIVLCAMEKMGMLPPYTWITFEYEPGVPLTTYAAEWQDHYEKE